MLPQTSRILDRRPLFLSSIFHTTLGHIRRRVTSSCCLSEILAENRRECFHLYKPNSEF